MAKIQLDQEVLAIETLIEERNHDTAFRRLVLAKDRFARRPEYRYLQALFDATFNGRPVPDLIRDVSALVADQPDFLEAVSLLAVLYDSTGDRARAEVFAREAARAKNPVAQERARKVLGGRPTSPPADQMPYRPTGRFPEVGAAEEASFGSSPEVAAHPVVTPSAAPLADLERKSTRNFVAVEAPRASQGSGTEWDRNHTQPRTEDKKIDAAPERNKTQPRPDGLDGIFERNKTQPRPDGLDAIFERNKTQPRPDGIDTIFERNKTQPRADGLDGIFERNKTQPRPQIGSSPEHERAGNFRQDQAFAETIPFSPSGMPMPPPPTIPPEALASSTRPPSDIFSASHEAPTAPGIRSVGSREPVDSDPNGRAVAVPRISDFGAPPAAGKARESSRLSSRPPAALQAELATDNTGIGRGKASSVSRPAIAAPPPVDQQRQWFKYARVNQVAARPGGTDGGTALMLLDLAERAVLGQTPLCPDPVPLDRRGLIIVEKKLDAQREATKSSQSPAERAAATTGAAFLLALLMKECDARAVDTTPEDGACKVILEHGAAVRPLLVAASYMRGRGPGLLDTFDRAATAHMRRASQVPPPPQQSSSITGPTPRPMRPYDAQRISDLPPTLPKPEFGLVVGHRELDAGTIATLSEDAPRGPNPRVSFRARAEQFWSSSLGREVAGSGRRIGSFAIADVDAIERYLTKKYEPVGVAPPGKAWPWLANDDQEEQILDWGAVLGEVLCSLYGGRWECDPRSPDDLRLVRVVLTGGVVAWPMAKVYLRLARGITHDLSVFVDSVGRVAAGQAKSY